LFVVNILGFFCPNFLSVVNPCFSSLTPNEQAPTAPPAAGELIVRAVTQTDLISLAELLAESFHSQMGIWRWAYPLLRLGIYEDLRSRLRSLSPNYIFLVAVALIYTPAGCQEYLVGTVEMGLRSIAFTQRRSSQCLYISNLAVRRSYRRCGVAQKLLLTCDQTAMEWGYQDIYLHVLENNHQARQLYLKTGYQLYEMDNSWSSYLLRQPKRMLLHKHFAVTTG
jgi:ribosomal protein S18 acetylase RimI-like enzyme